MTPTDKLVHCRRCGIEYPGAHLTYVGRYHVDERAWFCRTYNCGGIYPRDIYIVTVTEG